MSASLFAACILFAGCDKDDEISAVTLQSITSETFSYKGGLGTLVVNSDGGFVSATSSDPDWCRVQVMENTVLFNVIAYTGKEDRTATITVESGALMPLQMQITQTRFEGLIVTPHHAALLQRAAHPFVYGDGFGRLRGGLLGESQ